MNLRINLSVYSGFTTRSSTAIMATYFLKSSLNSLTKTFYKPTKNAFVKFSVWKCPAEANSCIHFLR